MRKYKLVGWCLIYFVAVGLTMVTPLSSWACRLFRTRHRSPTPCCQTIDLYSQSGLAYDPVVSPLESTYASPGPYARLIRTGTFPGRWHNDAIDFEFKEFDKSKFQGVATFTGGVHAGSRFDFTGELSTNGELSIDRTLPGGKQQSVRAGRWSIKNGEYVWQAKTTGLHASDRPFELRVPSMIKLGSFEGKWHGDPVTFRIVEIFANGLFSGVAKFTAGPHAGFEFVFTSEVDMFTGIGGLKINRNTESGIQSVTAFYPKLVNGVFVWRGFTTGVGAGNRIFELQIPQ